jgi:hypothetical protein
MTVGVTTEPAGALPTLVPDTESIVPVVSTAPNGLNLVVRPPRQHCPTTDAKSGFGRKTARASGARRREAEARPCTANCVKLAPGAPSGPVWMKPTSPLGPSPAPSQSAIVRNDGTTLGRTSKSPSFRAGAMLCAILRFPNGVVLLTVQIPTVTALPNVTSGDAV